MKILFKASDGGKDSGVTGYWLIEWKSMFSIVLLRFSKGSREAFHSHAFNALTWWLKGRAVEHFEDNSPPKTWTPSIKPKYTPRRCFHKIFAEDVTWALSIRGPWEKTWFEKRNNTYMTLSQGRRVEHSDERYLPDHNK